MIIRACCRPCPNGPHLKAKVSLKGPQVSNRVTVDVCRVRPRPREAATIARYRLENFVARPLFCLSNQQKISE